MKNMNSRTPSSDADFLILAINPGSTSTKIAVFRGETTILIKNISHDASQLSRFVETTDQHEFRKQLILEELAANHIPIRFHAVIGRGGLGKPISGGVYHINDTLCNDMKHAQRKHACNLGCLIAAEIAASIPGCLALTADPVMVDELIPEARFSGLPEIPRRAIWHALNQRAIARRFAREQGKRYENLNLIVCHLGGGVSIAAHRNGQAIDVNNALDGEGPFSPERAGTLPIGDLIRLCFSGRYQEAELLRMVTGRAGLEAHTGSKDVKALIGLAEAGDEKVQQLIEAMTYQISKSAAAQAAVFRGQVDAILLTGGMAHAPYITSRIADRIDWIAPVYIYPGEGEMEALGQNALGVLTGELNAKHYE